jgi:hypothetical protein
MIAMMSFIGRPPFSTVPAPTHSARREYLRPCRQRRRVQKLCQTSYFTAKGIGHSAPICGIGFGPAILTHSAMPREMSVGSMDAAAHLPEFAQFLIAI